MSMNYARAKRGQPDRMQALRLDHAAPHGSHSEGWPHLDRRGNCLCTKRCCLGPGGCCCETCGHRSHPRELVTA